MQMNPVAESARWVIDILVLFGIWMAFILYVILSSPAQGTKSLGGFLLAIAVLNVLFYKSTGRKFFAKTQSSRPFVARFWARSGEVGTPLLFLGIGVILAAAARILLIAGAA